MTYFQNGAVKAGLMTGGGLLVTRISMARTSWERVLAVGVAGIEVGGVFLVEWKAKKLAEEITAWRKAQDADIFLSAAKDEEQRRDGAVYEIKTSIASVEADIKARERGNDMESLKALAVAQARAGFLAGIAANRAGGIVPQEAA